MTEFISRNCGKEGYEIIIKTNNHELYRAAEDFARRLIDHSTLVTNADYIRSMSDEELKEFICSMFKCEYCDFELGERCGLLNWLQMPAEEADNGKVD